MAQLADFELRTLPGLQRQYDEAPRQLAFRAQTLEQAHEWQEELRDVLTRLLGGFPSECCDLDSQTLEVAQEPDYTRELIVFQSRPGEYVPCYVLIPHAALTPYRPVVALHGHGASPHQLVGIDNDEIERQTSQAQNLAYGRMLALRGFMVFVPGQRGIAERMEAPVYRSDVDRPWVNSCQMEGMNALLFGQTLLGLRVWDVMRLLDYIRSRNEPMIEGIGCVGLSGGGTTTLFTTALDKRISCSVVSGYFNTFRDSLMAHLHCSCNFVPGILHYAEMAEIAGLIAPRPLLIESGREDPIFPVNATEQALETLSAIYSVFDAQERLGADIFKGPHRWNGVKAYPWLDHWLV